ncbi:hypothetical protein [Mycobacterium sp.]|uniref:hypothetical protein n=1 Tax=Mycobacterium sp. TaxID=1785 RepID=UPI002D9027E7|nr:hypothetical protein [Mycobacterium sp.]
MRTFGKPGRRRWPSYIVAALALTVAVLGVVVIDRAGTDDADAPESTMDARSSQILRKDLDVDVGRFAPAANPLLETGKLPVTLRNKGRDTASFRLHVEAVDAAGNRIADDTAQAANMSPGQFVIEDLFIVVPTDRYDAMSHATFRVVEVDKY